MFRVSAAPPSPASAPELTHQRVAALDAARGAAMVLVCVSHFSYAYLSRVGASSAVVLASIAMVASPAFMLISGLTLGYLYESRASHRNALRIKLLDRAAFMLLFVHPVLALAEHARYTTMASALQTGFITDTVAVAMILGPMVLQRSRISTRVVLGIACVAATWVILALWQPSEFALRAVRGTITGSMGPGTVAHFPILPWFGVYLIGTALGQWIHQEYAGARARASWLLFAWGAGAALLAGALRAVAHFSHSAAFGPSHPLLSVWQKHPPSPIYFLWFGGCALMMVGLCAWLDERQAGRGVMSLLKPLGQASLVAFVLQDVIFFSGFYGLHIPYTPWWPLALAGSILAIMLATRVWVAIDGNRYLTIGIPLVLREDSQRNRAKELGRNPSSPSSV